MNIVIIGGGSVGAAISAELAQEGHAITVVDTDTHALAELSFAHDINIVEGNGASVDTLRKAGVSSADLLIAMTAEDEINILSCAAAKKLGAANTVARVRNPEYSDLMELLHEEMNLTLTVNPELTAARDIYRTLRFPAAAKIDTFCGGRVEMAEFTVTEDSPLCGMSLFDLRSKLNIKFLVCSVLREGVAHIPSGNFVIKGGDAVCVTAQDDEIVRFFKAIKLYKQPVRNVLIAGGGRITYYLEHLLERGKIRSTVIEKDRTLCREIAERYPSCTVVCDNGTKQELLLKEGLESADAFLALSDVDEENAIVSMFSKKQTGRKTVTLISEMPYIDFFKSVGLDSIVSPKYSTSAFIVRYVRAKANSFRASEIEALHRLMGGQAEALEFHINAEIEDLTDVPLKELRSRSGVLVACIVRRNAVIIPSGDDRILVGDTVIIVATGGQLQSIKDIME